MTTNIIGADNIGTIARYSDENSGFSFLYYLTPCCGADATGVSVTADNPAGVACRACYRPISAELAGQPAEPAPAPRRWQHPDGLVTFQW